MDNKNRMAPSLRWMGPIHVKAAPSIATQMEVEEDNIAKDLEELQNVCLKRKMEKRRTAVRAEENENEEKEEQLKREGWESHSENEEDDRVDLSAPPHLAGSCSSRPTSYENENVRWRPFPSRVFPVSARGHDCFFGVGAQCGCSPCVCRLLLLCCWLAIFLRTFDVPVL